MKFNLLNTIKENTNEITTENQEKRVLEKNINKTLFFKKIYPKKESTDLHQEISFRQKVISNIKKKLESHLLIINDNQDISISSEQQKSNDNTSLKNKLKNNKRGGDSILDKKIKIGPMMLYALRKRGNSRDIAKEKKLSISKNFVYSPFKDVIMNNEYKKIKLNATKKRENKNNIAQKNINSITLNLNKINIEPDNNHINKQNLLNKTYFNYKGRNDNLLKRIFKKKISWNSYSPKNEKINYNKYNQQEYNSFLNENNDLRFSNWTTRNQKIIYPDKMNNQYNSDSNDISSNFYINNYSEKTNNINFNKENSTSNKNTILTNNFFTNSNNDIININSAKRVLINKKFNLKNNKFNTKYILKDIKKHSNSPIYHKIKTNIDEKTKINDKKISNKFKLFLNRKVNSLNNIAKACNTELIRIIDMNSKEDINNIKIKNNKIIDEIKNELDIRKDILDKHTNDKNNKGKLKKYKVLMNDVKVEMNLSDIEDKNIMNLIKKKINIISDSIALNMIEKCLGIKENIGFDIDELFNEHINRKKDIQKHKIQEIRKRAENNYQKMVKLRRNLSESKIYNIIFNNNEIQKFEK